MPVVTWPENVDEVIAGDQVVALGFVTPARGVVLTPVTNFALRDRPAGRLTCINSSVGMHKKLGRIRENPKIALAYHTRNHSFTDRQEYVLVQGEATLGAVDPHYPRTIRDSWERFGGPVDVGPLWSWWLRAYETRIPIHLRVERMVVWPDLACEGVMEVLGCPLAAPPAPQRPPGNGTGPRIDHRRAAARAAKLPDSLLAWVDGDGFPFIVPTRVGDAQDEGMVLELPPGVLPAGGRRAGMVAHWFARYTAGQNQRKHTGWLEAAEAGGRRAVYAPHTDKGYRMPASMFVYRLSAGAVTRRGYRGAVRAGLVPGASEAAR